MLPIICHLRTSFRPLNQWRPRTLRTVIKSSSTSRLLDATPVTTRSVLYTAEATNSFHVSLIFSALLPAQGPPSYSQPSSSSTAYSLLSFTLCLNLFPSDLLFPASKSDVPIHPQAINKSTPLIIISQTAKRYKPSRLQTPYHSYPSLFLEVYLHRYINALQIPAQPFSVWGAFFCNSKTPCSKCSLRYVLCFLWPNNHPFL